MFSSFIVFSRLLFFFLFSVLAPFKRLLSCLAVHTGALSTEGLTSPGFPTRLSCFRKSQSLKGCDFIQLGSN